MSRVAQQAGGELITFDAALAIRSGLPNDAIIRFRAPYGFLSNMAACSVEYDGIEYASVEHAFASATSLDSAYREKICRSLNPVAAKRMAKSANVRPGWNEMQVDVMLALLRQKFDRDKFRNLLLSTGDVLLVEGNAHGDSFWGMSIDNDGHLRGENRLGQLLMTVRKEVRTRREI
ncbi:MAG: NADAR family protein [Capsulimonadaceae bacterium]|nr:NADAR family protein [Capsulimonadaceae bacterium]